MRNKGGDNIANPDTTVTVHMDDVDTVDMPCSVYATRFHTGEISFRLELFNTTLWMSPQQVKELRLALKPSRLEEVVDEITE